MYYYYFLFLFIFFTITLIDCAIYEICQEKVVRSNLEKRNHTSARTFFSCISTAEDFDRMYDISPKCRLNSLDLRPNIQKREELAKIILKL
jgi:hypothetical protein